MKAMRNLSIKTLLLQDGDVMEEAAVLAERYDIDFDDDINAMVMRVINLVETTLYTSTY